MDAAVYLDLAATIPLTMGIVLLLREKVSLAGVKAGSVSRLNLFFLSALIFDILRLLGNDWATYGILTSIWLIFNGVGTFAGNFYYCPESRALKETLLRLRRNPSFYLYHGILTVWLALNILFPSLYLPTTVILLVMVIAYPSRLFFLARMRAKIARVKEMLTALAVSWVVFVTMALALFALGAQPPILGISMPFAWEMAFLTGSLLLLVMSKVVIDPAGLTRSWAALFVPETIIRIGKRYLIIHDSGGKTKSFLASSFKNLISTGARIIINTSAYSTLLQELIESDQRFSGWMRDGKLVSHSLDSGKTLGAKEGISGKFGLGPASTVYVTQLDRENLLEKTVNSFSKESPNTSELFLLESSEAPRSQIAEFIRRNNDIQLLDLSERTNPFSGLLNIDHAKLQGATILLEYESSSNYEDAVDKFLTEGIANAEMSVLFTSKSSKLYRAIKGKKMIKLVAASSLVSAPDELPDGEVQIPDKELGLVTSIASDFLENNENMSVSFVFDSLSELIRAERWEQVYSGVKQLVELLSVPNASALFLVNRDSSEPRFMGALRSLFSVLMKLDADGLHLTKSGTL